jgi:integrase
MSKEFPKNNHKQIIYDFIKDNNNNITDSSIKTYTNYIYKLYYNIYDLNDEFEPYNFITQRIKFIKYLNELKNCNSIKSYISAIINILKKFNDNKDIEYKNDYIELMNKKAEEYENGKKDNKMNDKEKNNWIEYDDIIDYFNKLIDNIHNDLNKKGLTKILYIKFQNVIILAFYLLLPCRRLEYCYVKYKNYDINKDNYFDKKNKQIIFNIYKTKKFYDTQKLDINNKLYDMLNTFLTIKKIYSDSDYILSNNKDLPFSKSTLNQTINKIFNKKKGFSINMLRKITATNLLKPLININKYIKDMGSSNNEIIKTYIKKESF